MFVATTLHENINGIAVLIDGTPQIVPFPLDAHKDFVDVLGIPQPPLSFLELACVCRPKLLTPLPNRFIGDRDASFGEEFFHFTEAQTKTMVHPDGVTDDFRGKTMALVAGCWLFHVAQSAKPELN